jgi:hypothetical protein
MGGSLPTHHGAAVYEAGGPNVKPVQNARFGYSPTPVNGWWPRRGVLSRAKRPEAHATLDERANGGLRGCSRNSTRPIGTRRANERLLSPLDRPADSGHIRSTPAPPGHRRHNLADPRPGLTRPTGTQRVRRFGNRAQRSRPSKVRSRWRMGGMIREHAVTSLGRVRAEPDRTADRPSCLSAVGPAGT